MKPTRQELLEKSGSELVDIHNIHCDMEQAITGPWKKAKSILVDMILETMPEDKPDEKPTRTIRIVALELLCEVVYYEDKTKNPSDENRVEASHKNARSVGIPYLEIIDRIKEEFPEAETSAACLRWYAVKVRAGEFGYEDFRLVQRRPRAKPVK